MSQFLQVKPNVYFDSLLWRPLRFSLYIAIAFSNETVKCSWSDSRGSSRDYYVFMYSYIEVAEAENTASNRHASVCVQ